MYWIITQFSSFIIAPLEDYSFNHCHHVFDDVSEAETLRIIRLLIFNGSKNICIHTNTYENKEGWAYALHNLYNNNYTNNYTNNYSVKDKKEILGVKINSVNLPDYKELKNSLVISSKFPPQWKIYKGMYRGEEFDLYLEKDKIYFIYQINQSLDTEDYSHFLEKIKKTGISYYESGFFLIKN